MSDRQLAGSRLSERTEATFGESMGIELSRKESYVLSQEYMTSQRNFTPEQDQALDRDIEKELKVVRRWHYIASVLTAIDASFAFSCQLLYAVGINKIMQNVFQQDFRDVLDDFWENLLLYDVSFEAYISLLVTVFVVISISSGTINGSKYYFSKKIERIIRVRLARAILVQEQSTTSFDDLLELTKSTKVVERYVAQVKYDKFWAYVLILVGLIFTFVIAPFLALILFGMFAAMLLFVLLFNTVFLVSRKRKIDEKEILLEEIMVDIVAMKELILLSDRDKAEVQGLVAIGKRSILIITATAKLIILSQLVRHLVVFLTIPVLLAYTFYTVTNANELFQIIVVILCCFQFNAAFQKIYLLENQTDEFHLARDRLRKVIDTSGLEFLLGKTKASEDEADDEEDDALNTSSKSVYFPDDSFLIELRNVSASYIHSSFEGDWILRHVNLKIDQGDRVVILGETGCGKSTLLNVMLGFVKPIHGRMFVDGKRLVYEHEDLIDWRKQVTVVSQDSPMFRRTIYDNITYGLPDVTEEEVEEAVKKACLTDWLNTLKDGIHTLLDGREKQLSGGQRQRIQICRALLSEKNIVFMDEPTASLDPLTRETIMDSLADHFVDKTAICITHDLNMLKIFDRAFRLSQEEGLVEDETLRRKLAKRKKRAADEEKDDE